MREVVVIMISMLSFGVHPVCAQLTVEQHEPAKAQFVIGPKFVHMPDKFFLLIRKGRETGAYQLTSIEYDAQGNGKSTYESYFQGDGSGTFLSPNVVKRTGEINIKPMRGVHAFAWQPGQYKLRVGKWWFGCYSPGLVNMSSHFSQKDEGYEFAPTSAQNVAEIDASDKRLRWFRYLVDSSITVSVSELPK